MVEKIINKTGDFCGLTFPVSQNKIIDKINELVDVVNKQNDILRQIGEWGTQNGQCLYCETLTSFNPPKKDNK